MTVLALIKRLQKYDPKMTVTISTDIGEVIKIVGILKRKGDCSSDFEGKKIVEIY